MTTAHSLRSTLPAAHRLREIAASYTRAHASREKKPCRVVSGTLIAK
jgi:hypothetical protein